MNGATMARFHIPTKVVRGMGAVEEIGIEALALEAKRSLIVTDKNIKEAGLVSQHAFWGSSNYKVFSRVVPTTYEKTVDKSPDYLWTIMFWV